MSTPFQLLPAPSQLRRPIDSARSLPAPVAPKALPAPTLTPAVTRMAAWPAPCATALKRSNAWPPPTLATAADAVLWGRPAISIVPAVAQVTVKPLSTPRILLRRLRRRVSLAWSRLRHTVRPS